MFEKLITIEIILDNYRKNFIRKHKYSNCLENFFQICINTLEQTAPRKEKNVRGNNMPIII